ncbi:hypothetical protein HPG69_013979 [Diceros bicornis minor]|uniref:Uncharacterized protein n=1 Tax=Diceros bicornis minor TaxID=77932 RepID=A0A7J7EMN4_DICBM|nr:hypothetical protein HPG69_013979 [Diceros bicornis minor]
MKRFMMRHLDFKLALSSGDGQLLVDSLMEWVYLRCIKRSSDTISSRYFSCPPTVICPQICKHKLCSCMTITSCPPLLSFPSADLSSHDVSPTRVIKKLQPKENSSTGEVFQTLMLGRHESQEIKDFYFREIQKNMHEFECQWRNDERSYQRVPVTCKKNLTNRRDQHGRKDAGNKLFENRLGLSLQDELQVFQMEGETYECNQHQGGAENNVKLLYVIRLIMFRVPFSSRATVGHRNECFTN